jgi:hypothetical protein
MAVAYCRSIGNTSLLLGPELGRGSFGKVFKGAARPAGLHACMHVEE